MLDYDLIRTFMPSTAWCVDRYGNSYSVYVHPFGSTEFDCNDEHAAWLWCNDFNIVKKYCEEYLCVRYVTAAHNPDEDDFDFDKLFEYISDELYSIECVNMHPKLPLLVHQIQQLCRKNIDKLLKADLPRNTKIGDSLTRYLNSNIVRVRLGSEYSTKTDDPGAIYFRISSNGFDWSDVIYHFMESIQTRSAIKTISVERDRSSTGEVEFAIDHLTVSDFFENTVNIRRCINDCCRCSVYDTIEPIDTIIYQP